MHRGHLETWEVAALLDGELPERDLRIARGHLFECASCEKRMTEVLRGSGPSPRPADDTSERALTSDALPELPHDLFLPDLQQIYQRLEGERRDAEALFEQADSLGLIAPESSGQLDRTFATWGFFELLLRQARLLWTPKPQHSHRLLQLALQVVARLDAKVYGTARIETAKVRAWGHLGNIERVLGDFAAAEKSFRRAEFHYWQSELDPLDEANLFEFRSVLRRHQGRFAEAMDLIDDAIAVYREINEPHREGRVRMSRGIIELSNGNPAAAAEEFRVSLSLIDPSQDPNLQVYGRMNLLLCLVEAGDAAQAELLLPEVKQLSSTPLTGSDSLRLRWIEARIALERGRLGEAESGLRQLRTAYVEAELGLDAALVTLDLAALLVQMGRTGETRELVQEMVPVFDALQIRREALAALIVLQKAAEAEHLSLALVRETVLRVRLGALGVATGSPVPLQD